MAIKDARCNVPPCPSCAAKDAEIERLRAALSEMLWGRAQQKAERALRGEG